MFGRAIHVKAMALALCVSILFATAPFTLAETVAAPLGTIVTKGNVNIGNAVAPTGTTILTGDQVASSQAALINFSSGSRIEMTKAVATFARKGSTLVVNTNEGLLRFNFKKGEDVQINAGKFQFTGNNDSDRAGELGLNNNGEIAMFLTKGSFTAVNTVTGIRTLVSPTAPMAVVNPTVPTAAPSPRGMSKSKMVLIIAGVAAAVGLGIAIHSASKSSSAR
jgi:hypothetical protein